VPRNSSDELRKEGDVPGITLTQLDSYRIQFLILDRLTSAFGGHCLPT
jgi:hypothetical protein